MTLKIVHKKGHYEILNEEGRFISSADTRREAEDEAMEYMVEQYRKNQCKAS